MFNLGMHIHCATNPTYEFYSLALNVETLYGLICIVLYEILACVSLCILRI